MQTAVRRLEDPEQIAAVAHPLRARILEAMRTPDTAAGVARACGRSRQSISYHVKALERVGLLRRTGERRKGNFVEQLYESTSRRFIVSAHFAADPERLAAVFRDQVSLSQLSELGERLQSDAAALIDQAAFEGTKIPSASLEAELCLPDEAARAAFMNEFLASLKSLLAKHGSKEGQRFRVAFATYPNLEEEE